VQTEAAHQASWAAQQGILKVAAQQVEWVAQQGLLRVAAQQVEWVAQQGLLRVVAQQVEWVAQQAGLSGSWAVAVIDLEMMQLMERDGTLTCHRSSLMWDEVQEVWAGLMVVERAVR